MSRGRGRRRRRETRAHSTPATSSSDPPTSSSDPPTSSSAPTTSSSNQAVHHIPSIENVAGYKNWLMDHIPGGSLVENYRDSVESICCWTLPGTVSATRWKYLRSDEFRIGESEFWCSILFKPCPKRSVQISLHLAVGLHDDKIRWNRLFRVCLGIVHPDDSKIDPVVTLAEGVRLHYADPTYGLEEFTRVSEVADCNRVVVGVRLVDEQWQISSATAGLNPGMFFVNLKWCINANDSKMFLNNEKEDLLAPSFELVEGLFCSVDIRHKDGDVFAVVKTYLCPADCESCLVFGVITMGNGDYKPFSDRAFVRGEIAVILMDYSMWNSNELIVNGRHRLCASIYYIKDAWSSKRFKDDGNFGVKYTWIIKNLAQMKDIMRKDKGKRKMGDISVKSTIFNIGSYSCWLVLYPRGREYRTHVSIYLDFFPSDNSAPVSARVSIHLRNHKDETRSLTNEIQATLDKEVGWEDFISMEQFYDPDKGFYNEGAVVLILKIQILPKVSPADGSPAEESLVKAISPGVELHHIVPHDADLHADKEAQEESNATPDPPIWSEIMSFLTNKDKPMILALSSLEPIKNLTTLVKAYGECHSLREHANLILITGNRKDIKEMSETNASVLTSMLYLIEKYNLYGHVAYPKHHKPSDIPDIYRLAAKTKGVFINPAFIEPSGLTSIEAAACGLPTVATRNGGDVIIETLKNGLLIDPHDQQSIAEALLKLVGDENLWERCRQNGWKNICLYRSWTKHCEDDLSLIARCKTRQLNWNISDTGDEESKSDSPGLSMNPKLFLEEDKTKIATAVEEAKSDVGHQQVRRLRANGEDI